MSSEGGSGRMDKPGFLNAESQKLLKGRKQPRSAVCHAAEMDHFPIVMFLLRIRVSDAAVCGTVWMM